MASIFKRKGQKNYTIRYYDENGIPRDKAGFPDKARTKALADRIEQEVREKKLGFRGSLEEQEAKKKREGPIEKLIDDFISELVARGRSKQHTDNTKRHINKICSTQGIQCAEEITSGRVREFCASKKGSGRTKNAYRDAIYALCEWCVKQEILKSNPIKKVGKFQAKKQNPRRPFSAAEIKTIRESGLPEGRKTAYLLAAYSGLRYREIKELLWSDVDLEEGKFKLRAEATKGRRSENIPMLPECKELLVEWKKKTKNQSVFEKMVRLKTLKRDLQRLGIQIKNESGKLDFHSFRYGFCTAIGKILPIQRVKVLMRHKDIRETANIYMQLGLEDAAEESWTPPKVF